MGHFTVESLGYVPGFCFQCGDLRAMRLRRIYYHSARFMGSRSVEWDLEECCLECGLRTPADPSQQTITELDQRPNLRAWGMEAFGTDSAMLVFTDRAANIRSGMASDENRFDLMARCAAAMSAHHSLPRIAIKRHHRRCGLVLLALIVLGIITINILSTIVHDSRTPIDEMDKVGFVLRWSIPWILVSVAATYITDALLSGRSVNPVSNEHSDRLVRALAQYDPSGHEVRGVMRVARQEGWRMPPVSADDLLLRCKMISEAEELRTPLNAPT